MRIIGCLFYITAIPIAACFIIAPLLGIGVTLLYAMLFLAAWVATRYSVKNVVFAEIIDTETIYTREHRYAGTSVGWFRGQPVAHFSYEQIPLGKCANFWVYYSNRKPQKLSVGVGGYRYDVLMQYVNIPRPVINAFPRRGILHAGDYHLPVGTYHFKAIEGRGTVSMFCCNDCVASKFLRSGMLSGDLRFWEEIPFTSDSIIRIPGGMTVKACPKMPEEPANPKNHPVLKIISRVLTYISATVVALLGTCCILACTYTPSADLAISGILLILFAIPPFRKMAKSRKQANKLSNEKPTSVQKKHSHVFTKRMLKTVLSIVGYSFLIMFISAGIICIVVGTVESSIGIAAVSIVFFLCIITMLHLLTRLHSWNREKTTKKRRGSLCASPRQAHSLFSDKSDGTVSKHTASSELPIKETTDSATGIISTFYNTLCESTNGGQKRCNGDCENCPPHYGYRYGRWYYGHHHNRGCEFGGNKGL